MIIRPIFSYLLIFAFSLHFMAEAAIYLSFKINQDYIAEFLCIEKDIPDSNCQGCCQLKNKLEEHEKQKQEAPQSENKKYEIQLFADDSGITQGQFPSSEIIGYQIVYTKGVLLAYSLFHPPKDQA
ncbi:hypothetical protein [uncultured Sunxiuqinia sp.]|uniref:hypothetical protein n=1 Tax=uncultured Sunxiuqinia sp. TaxID=1573825 RepID=UPI0026200BDE|nr:hypothetical protein [uncultured Sunxiuqinia sp.]